MTLRPEVAEFAQVMEHKLRQNDHKGGWQGMGQVRCLAAGMASRLRGA